MEMSPLDDLRAVPRPRQSRKRGRAPNPEARGRLMEAASELILEHGVPRLRVEDVARKAGLSVGTFYIYFRSKDDLFTQLVVDYTGRLRERMRSVYTGPGSLADRVAGGLAAYLDFVEENAKGFLHFRDTGSILTNAGPLSSWALEQHAQDLRPLLDEGIESGVFRPMNTTLAAQALLGMIQHTAAYWLENEGTSSREELQHFVLELTGRGLLK